MQNEKINIFLGQICFLQKFSDDFRHFFYGKFENCLSIHGYISLFFIFFVLPVFLLTAFAGKYLSFCSVRMGNCRKDFTFFCTDHGCSCPVTKKNAASSVFPVDNSG